jgi:NADP-dependent 3-hydroxy acid dehydrogenase YdfG
MELSSVVVITGASADLGRAIAHAFAKLGAKLGLLARNPEALAAAKQECEELGGRAIFIPTDVFDGDAVERAASARANTRR